MYENLIILILNNLNYVDYFSFLFFSLLIKIKSVIKNFFLSVLTKVFFIKFILFIINKFTDKLDYLASIDFTQLFNPFIQINELNYLFHIQQIIDYIRYNEEEKTITNIIRQVFKNPIYNHLYDYINENNINIQNKITKKEKIKITIVILFIIYLQLNEILNNNFNRFNILKLIVNFFILIYNPLWTINYIISNLLLDKLINFISNAYKSYNNRTSDTNRPE